MRLATTGRNSQSFLPEITTLRLWLLNVAAMTALQSCRRAIRRSLKLTGDGGSTTIKHNLFLHTKTEGMISQFLICIGQKKHGEPTRPNWNAMIGAKGRAKVSIRTWKGNDGSDYQSNQIKKFYEPETHETATFTPGTF